MRKRTKEFLFHYPLKQQMVRNLRIVTEHIGDLEVEGIGYFNPSASVLNSSERFRVDIDSVKWQGTDIRPVLELAGIMDDISEAAIRHFAREFENSLREAA
jgi:hypothetical protein